MSLPVAEIMQIEGWAEDGFIALLKLALMQAAVGGEPLNPDYIYRQRGCTVAETPRVEVLYKNGEPYIQHQHLFLNGIDKIYDTFSGELRVRVITNRTTDQGEPDDETPALPPADPPPPAHEILLGQVRLKCQAAFARRLWENPVLALLDIREQDSNANLDDTGNTDATELIWWVMVQIKPDVWPADIM